MTDREFRPVSLQGLPTEDVDAVCFTHVLILGLQLVHAPDIAEAILSLEVEKVALRADYFEARITAVPDNPRIPALMDRVKAQVGHPEERIELEFCMNKATRALKALSPEALEAAERQAEMTADKLMHDGD
jgi:hypothetical protein